MASRKVKASMTKPSTEKLWLRRALAALLWAYAILSVLLVAHWVPRRFYPWAAPMLTVLGTAAALLHAEGQVGRRRAWAFFALTFAVGLGMETVGARTGWIYGPYHYTQKLGWRFLETVPVIIPLAWFMMMYPSWLIARRVLAVWARTPRWAVAAVGGLVMTAWDVLMDPLMVHLGHWVWEAPGGYFGVPAQNFAGWWATAFLAMGLFEMLLHPPALKETPAAPLRWGVVLYLLVGASNLAAAITQGLTGPAVAGFWAMAPWVVTGWLASRTSPR